MIETKSLKQSSNQLIMSEHFGLLNEFEEKKKHFLPTPTDFLLNQNKNPSNPKFEEGTIINNSNATTTTKLRAITLEEHSYIFYCLVYV